MADRKPFLLRLDPELHAALQHWADDELRSLNAQIEFLLRRALREAGRLKKSPNPDATSSSSSDLPAEEGSSS
jgi:hypothetical protein